MEKTLEAAELERTRLMELVKSLELKMNSLEQVYTVSVLSLFDYNKYIDFIRIYRRQLKSNGQ